MRRTRTTSILFFSALLLVLAHAARARSQSRTDEITGLDAAALVGEAHRNGARMADRVVLRLEAWPANSSGKQEPAVVYEEIKAGGGVWMRGLSRIDTTRDPEFFGGVNVYFNGVFSDYRRFGTEFDGYRLAAPKAQD